MWNDSNVPTSKRILPPSKVNVDNEPNTKKRFFPSELREAKSRALHLATATGKLSTGTLYQWKRHLIPRIERNDWQLKHRQRAFLREDEQKVLQVFMKRKHTHSQYQAYTWIEFQSFLGDFRNLTKNYPNNEWKTFLVYAVRLCLQNKSSLKRQKPSLVALVQCDLASSTKVTPFNSKDPNHRGLRSELGWTWHLFHGKRDPAAVVLQMNLFRLHDHPRK